jgi:hypothetical protein
MHHLPSFEVVQSEKHLLDDHADIRLIELLIGLKGFQEGPIRLVLQDHVDVVLVLEEMQQADNTHALFQGPVHTDLVEQKFDPGFYRNYLLFRELLDGNFDRHCRALRDEFFRPANRRCLVVILALTPPFLWMHRLISPLFLLFPVLVIMISIWVVLCWLFVVGVHQVQLVGIESKLRGRLVQMLITIRHPLCLINLGGIGHVHRL